MNATSGTPMTVNCVAFYLNAAQLLPKPLNPLRPRRYPRNPLRAVSPPSELTPPKEQT